MQSFYRTAERVGRAFVGVFISVSRGVFASKRDGQVFKERRKKEERIYVLTSAAIHKLLFFLFMQYRSWRVLHCLQPLHCSLSLPGGGGPSATWGRTVPHLLFSFESLSPYLPIIHLTILCNDMQDLNLKRFNVPLCTFSHNAGNEANADCSSSLHSLSLTASSVH